MATPAEVEKEELGFSLETVREKSLRVVVRTTPSSDICVFLIHGGGGRAGQFKHQIRKLEKKYNVVALDFLGHGASPAPNEPRLYTVHEHLEDLKVVYEKHKNVKNVIIGHCYGAIHTLRLVKWLRDEGRETELMGVVILSLSNRAPVTLGRIGKLPAFLLEWLRPLARGSSNRTVFTPNTDPTLIQFENFMSSSNRMFMMKVIGADCSDDEMWKLSIQEGAMALANIPKIFIYGREDTTATFEEAVDTLGIGNDDCHCVEGVGHLVMLEAHEQVTEILQNFISKLTQN